jgi:hypothetical protein
MTYPVSANYMDEGGDRWTIGPEGELRILGTLSGGMYVKSYYVDNINGSASNAGLSWESAFAEISTAVTAWEAYRALQDNVYARGAIYVRGTGTAYTKLTALPSYCDIIGVGAEVRGNGTGIVMIGANGADGIAGTARGLGLYNLQFISGGAFWCADFVSLFRSSIVHCAFQATTAAADGGIRFSGASGGLVIRDCLWKGSGDVICKVGIQASGTHLNESIIENNVIGGTTAGILIDNTVKNGDQTVVRNNHIGDTGKGCVTAIDDNQPADLVGYLMYCNNSVMGTNLITIANSGAARCHGNVSANGFVAVTAS